MTFNEMLEAAQANIGKKFCRAKFPSIHVYFDYNGEMVCWYSEIEKLERYILTRADFRAIDWQPCCEPEKKPKDSGLSFAEVIEIWRKDWTVKARRAGWAGEVWKNGVEFVSDTSYTDCHLCMCDAAELQPHLTLADYLASDWEII